MSGTGGIISKGRWLIQDWDPDDVPTDPDVLLEAYEKGHGRMEDNLITDRGLREMARRNLGQSTTWNGRIGFGSSNTPGPLPSQNALIRPRLAFEFTETPSPRGTTERYVFTFDGDTFGTTLNRNRVGEMGIHTRPGTGLISRVIFDPILVLDVNRTYTVLILVTHKAVSA